MKYTLISVALLFSLAFAAVSVEPEYSRIPLGSNQTLSIYLEGEGRLYDLKVYGPSLSWQSKQVWVGPYGKELSVVFRPMSEGEYTITADMEGERDEVTAVVYSTETSDVYERIQELRSSTQDPEELAIINEAERLYNQSKIQLAEIKLSELSNVKTEDAPSSAPMFVLAALMALLAIAAFKVFL